MIRLLIIFMIFPTIMSCSTESRIETPAAQLSSDPTPASKKNAHVTEPPDTGEPAMHAVQNNRLQQVMQQINSLVYAQLSSEISLGQERQIKTEEIARIAGELAASEKSMIETMPSLNLKPNEEATFIALAEKLRLSAVQMETLARQHQLQGIPETLDNITNTCTSCHVLFRKSRSLLEKCRDPRYTC
ncbi:MAG: hypothetical protein Q8K07_10590 [Methylicorpusculum sp.]|uniref:hypothetical protein n=2 Tax=Methylicorpusculum sp. TaxID=2713644 RepID=UPI0027317684|nr:hypothetical protein [Methylicorpusculum sp.]MDP2202456.1 hypothetical protein [Methylicorpusculum sp.]